MCDSGKIGLERGFLLESDWKFPSEGFRDGRIGCQKG